MNSFIKKVQIKNGLIKVYNKLWAPTTKLPSSCRPTPWILTLLPKKTLTLAQNLTTFLTMTLKTTPNLITANPRTLHHRKTKNMSVKSKSKLSSSISNLLQTTTKLNSNNSSTRLDPKPPNLLNISTQNLIPRSICKELSIKSLRWKTSKWSRKRKIRTNQTEPLWSKSSMKEQEKFCWSISTMRLYMKLMDVFRLESRPMCITQLIM